MGSESEFLFFMVILYVTDETRAIATERLDKACFV